MKKTLFLCLILSALAVTALAGCSAGPGGQPPEVTPTPTPSAEATPPPPNKPEPPPEPDQDTLETLEAILEGANSDGDNVIPMTFNDPVTAENCEGAFGFGADLFERYVTEAYTAKAAINTFAFEVALVKCKDGPSAAEVKKLVADKYDHGKWVCVLPEQCFVTEAGSFVLLGAVSNQVAEALQNSFKTQFGNAGSVDTFYERGDETAGGGEGGFILP